eukprot:COSAG01_NODE_237_length_20722_cov_360.895747_19_plen_252_part_00
MCPACAQATRASLLATMMGRMLALLAALLVATVHAQTGCQSLLRKTCPSYASNDTEACLSCVEQHRSKLKAKCTRAKMDKKCEQGLPGPGPRPGPPAPPGPGPALPPVPPAPPLPPVPPIVGAPRPHMLLFVVDDMGWAALGDRNPNHVVTPNFDAAAAGGIILDRAYAYRWCSPTRSSLMTGRLPYHVLQGTNYVDRRFNMMSAKLGQVGYSTHQLGKWHMGAVAPWMTPHGRGFDVSSMRPSLSSVPHL